MSLWSASLTSFAVPGVLLVLSTKKNLWVRFCSVVWGLWLIILSTWVLIRIETVAPNATQYGFALVVFILLMALTLVSSALRSLYGQKLPPEPIKVAESEPPPE